MVAQSTSDFTETLADLSVAVGSDHQPPRRFHRSCVGFAPYGVDEIILVPGVRLQVGKLFQAYSYVTLMTDLSDPARPQILAVERGKDCVAALN